MEKLFVVQINDLQGWEIACDRPWNELSKAVNHMMHLCLVRPSRPIRVIDTNSGVVWAQNELTRTAMAQRTEPFWTVLSLDKPGPREREGGAYQQHASYDKAVSEARRMSAASRGGRFAVMQPIFVTGWYDEHLVPQEIGTV